MIKEEIGKRIRTIRNSKGYSQEKFAQVCGIDRTYIAGVETGKRNISLENLYKIAQGFNMSLAELCDYEAPVRKNIVLMINGDPFLLQSDKDITPQIAEELEIICDCAFEEECAISVISGLSPDELTEKSQYDIAEYFQKAVKQELGIKVTFTAINAELKINQPNY